MLQKKYRYPSLLLLALLVLALAPACDNGSVEPTVEEATPEVTKEVVSDTAKNESTEEPEAGEKPVEKPYSGTQIVVDGSGHKYGPLPVIFYALTAPDGLDVYPLGEGAFSLFGLYDSGSTKVRINNLDPPNRVSGPNWENSDAGHLNLAGVETVNLRLNSIKDRQEDGNIPIGPPGSGNEPQVDVQNLDVMPEEVDVSLIGAPVVNQLVAVIDYTNLYSDPAIEYAGTGIYPPSIDLYWPEEVEPVPEIALTLEPFGSLASGDATPGYRYWLRDIVLQEGNNVVTDQQNEFTFLFDTGTTMTLINDRVADSLGLSAVDPDFDCFGKPDAGYYIDSVSMYGSDGRYRVEDAAVCWNQDKIITGDAVIGSNFFNQVQIILDGPKNTLGISEPSQAAIVP